MSRTDAHRPYRVWIADHPELVVTRHDPATGERQLFLSLGVRSCGCNICTGRLWHTADRRALRTAERAFRRAAARGAADIELERLEGRLGSYDVR